MEVEIKVQKILSLTNPNNLVRYEGADPQQRPNMIPLIEKLCNRLRRSHLGLGLLPVVRHMTADAEKVQGSGRVHRRDIYTAVWCPIKEG